MQTPTLVQTPTVLLSHPELIDLFGRTSAQALSQLHYWIAKDQGNIHEGMRWVYNTIEELSQQIRTSTRTMKRCLAHLRKKGVLLTQKLSKNKSNRTNWYTIDYEKLEALRKKEESAKEDKMAPSWGQNGPMVNTKITYKDINKSEDPPPKPQARQVPLIKNGNRENTPPRTTTAQEMLTIWNETFPSKKTIMCKEIAPLLVAAFKTKFNQNLKAFSSYCQLITSSPWLMGDSSPLSLFWALRYTTIDRLHEGELGVKKERIPPPTANDENLMKKAETHLASLNESPACKAFRRFILKKHGAPTYCSWFMPITLRMVDKRMVVESENAYCKQRVANHYVDMEDTEHFVKMYG
jgi:hypothetical protein